MEAWRWVLGDLDSDPAPYVVLAVAFALWSLLCLATGFAICHVFTRHTPS
jgi:hypothetical protein